MDPNPARHTSRYSQFFADNHATNADLGQRASLAFSEADRMMRPMSAAGFDGFWVTCGMPISVAADTLLPALCKKDYDALEALAMGSFSSVGAVGYPMTTVMLPSESPYCIPAGQETDSFAAFLASHIANR